MDTFIQFVHNKRSDDSVEDASLLNVHQVLPHPPSGYRRQERPYKASGKACSLLLSHHLIQPAQALSVILREATCPLAGSWPVTSAMLYLNPPLSTGLLQYEILMA